MSLISSKLASMGYELIPAETTGQDDRNLTEPQAQLRALVLHGVDPTLLSPGAIWRWGHTVVIWPPLGRERAVA